MRADLAAWCMIFDGFQETIKFNNFLQFIPLKGPLKDTKRDPSVCRIGPSMLCCRHSWQEVFLRENQIRADSDMRRYMTESSHPLICPRSWMENLPDFVIVSRNSAGCSRSKAGSTLAAGPGAAPGKHLAPLRFDTNNHSQTFPPQTHVKMDWSVN